MSNLRLWPLRALWILVPLTTGAVVDDALADRVASFRVGATIVFWALWAITLVATLVPRVETLTAVRVVVPANVLATAWAAAATDIDGRAALAIAVAVAVVAVAFMAPDGEEFVNGSSYGDERRMPLRPPVAMLAGPIPLAWVACVAGVIAGPLLLLAHVWIAGAALTAIGLPLTVLSARALHQLSRRWVVFVPAGFVLHDHLALLEPVLFGRTDIVALGPALADTRARDLTAGAAGLALQVDFALPVSVTPTEPGDEAVEMVAITQCLFTPSRPGHVLAEAERRKIRVDRG